MGLYKDGSTRYEIRHLDDLRFAHPDSLAAPAHRPKLGRPGRSAPSNVSHSTEPVEQVPPETSRSRTNRLSLVPNPPLGNQPGALPVDNQQNGNSSVASHATSSTAGQQPSVAGNPANFQTTVRHSVRSTRNPNPQYIDGIQIMQRPWSASKQEIEWINKSVSNTNVNDLLVK